MNVLKYLTSQTSPEVALSRIDEEHGIRVKQYEDRVVLNYDIMSEKFDPIACECRGLILSYPDFTVLSRGFDRFFNYGEKDVSDTFHISRAETYSKEDGSYISVYFDGFKWNIATRGLAFAEGTSFTGDTFESLFLRAVGTKSVDSFRTAFGSTADPNWTYLFELCTRENRVVKNYGEDSVFFLAARNKQNFDNWKAPLDTDSQQFIETLRTVNLKIKYPQTYRFNSFDEVMKGIKELPGLDEGYVLWDRKTNQRVKCKSPSYLAVHHLRDNGVVSPKRISTLVFENDQSEYLSYFPEDKKYFEPYENAYKSLIEEINETWSSFKAIEDQKEFALSVKSFPFSGILFQLKKQPDKHIEDLLQTLHLDAKLRLLQTYL